MQFPTGGRAIMEKFYELHPELVKGDDNSRRALIKLVGEQFAFSFGPRWGNKKRAGLGDDFRSADSIAYKEDDGSVSVWDTQSGSDFSLLAKDGSEADYPHLPASDAAFMDCNPTDHLNLVIPTTPIPPDQGNPGVPKPPMSDEDRNAIDRFTHAFQDHTAAMNANTAALSALNETLKAGVTIKLRIGG